MVASRVSWCLTVVNYSMMNWRLIDGWLISSVWWIVKTFPWNCSSLAKHPFESLLMRCTCSDPHYLRINVHNVYAHLYCILLWFFTTGSKHNDVVKLCFCNDLQFLHMNMMLWKKCWECSRPANWTRMLAAGPGHAKKVRISHELSERKCWLVRVVGLHHLSRCKDHTFM